MGSLVHKVASSIRQRRLFRTGQPILVAVSGGVDSMVLLHLLHALAPQYGWRLAVAHLNHQLRGRSSDADERLVRRVAAKLTLPCVVGRANVRRLARARRLSVEMAARQARHEFLASTALKRGIHTIALAHHADDQLELFFLRLLRGGGSEGLAGMKWRNASPRRAGVQLARPLLDQPKSVLRQYAKEQRIPFREDASNAWLEIQRNRIRHELLPLLRRHYQPALERTVLRAMDILGAEAEFIGDAAMAWRKRARRGDRRARHLRAKRAESEAGRDPGSQGEAPGFEDLPLALQRRCLHLELLEQGVRPDFELVEQLRLHPGVPVTVNGPGEPPTVPRARIHPHGSSGIGLATDRQKTGDYSSQPLRVTRDASGRVRQCQPRNQEFNADQLAVRLNAKAGQATLSRIRVYWRLLGAKAAWRARGKEGQEVFDADKVGSQILLRHWQPGDRFQPIGMKRPVKLQDFFTNEKIPRSRRHELVLGVTGKGEVFWVEGMRIGEQFKLDEGTIRRLQWRWKER